jgi:predicted nucleic acid-binding protein
MIPTVYLDTNVFIEGSKRPEHHELKDLAIKGRLHLLIGPEVSREIRQQIFDLKDKEHEICVSKGKYTLKESAALLRAIDDKIKSLNKQLSSELLFWKDAKPEHSHNTFDAIILTISLFGLEFASAIDFKGEIALVLSLQRDFNIKITDAFHLMQAHSAKFDYFLTWDRKQLINRAKKVRWLIPKVMTPSDFLKALEKG